MSRVSPLFTRARLVLRQRDAIAGALDHWRGRCATLERVLAHEPSGVSSRPPSISATTPRTSAGWWLSWLETPSAPPIGV